MNNGRFEMIFKKYRYPVCILLVLIVIACIFFGKDDDDVQKNPEEIWEPSMVIENREYEEAGTSLEMSAWENEEPVGILTDDEEEYLKNTAISVAEQCADLYKDIKSYDTQTVYPQLEPLTEERRKEVVGRLGESGIVSVSENINMENYEKVEDFYSTSTAGNDAQVTIFDIHTDGSIASLTFICRGGIIQSYYVGIGWQEGGIPELRGTAINEIKEMKLTEKGYFIYTNKVTIAHGNLREYYRIKPLSDKCRELTEKYISGLSYVNYNMLVTNWDSSNVEEILMPCMFEDIYRITVGETLKTENGRISAKTYERVMTTCFPVSVEQLRNYCGYDSNSNTYEYEMIFSSQFPPFGEVVDYTENDNGTITIFVDGVWPDYNTDYAFTNQIVVQPFEDGTFRYLSNSIEQREIDIPQ